MIQLSVVICTYNRQKFIGACLNCLATQTFSLEKWEAIVVDNNSTDQSASIINAFITNHPQLPFRSVFEEKQGLSFARNRGLAESRGSIIVYIDDDVEVVPNYLEAIHHFFATHPQAVGMGGRSLPKFSEGPPPPWLNPYMGGITGTLDKGMEKRKFAGRMKYPAGCNMIYTKQILQQAGGFNNELKARADDKYIYEKVARLNDEVWYVPEAFSLHNIDAERLTDASFKRLYTKGGNEEKIKTRGEGGWNHFKKGMDLLMKTGVSLLLWLVYALRGRALPGRYIFLSQWYTLQGFFS